MAVGSATLPQFHPIAGIRMGIACAGIKKPGRKDLVIFELAPGSRTAAVFTRNQFCAAPIQVARAHLDVEAPRFLLINTGNANAGTGEQGLADAHRCCQTLAELTGVSETAVLPFSTGVIGEPLPVDRIIGALPPALDGLHETAWADAAEGIMTTDTRPKGATVALDLGGHRIHISGISKGSGMICPNMATMLAFVATDANVAPEDLQQFLHEAVEGSFNRITVDGDTSTNDACVMVATGQAGNPEIRPGTAEGAAFSQALNQLFLSLAQAIVRDAEGATKFVAIRVEEAATTEEALAVAYNVAHSPLVKTALFASDPNWGRILAVVGRSPLEGLDVGRVQIYLDEVCIVRDGCRARDYNDARGVVVMTRPELTIRICLGDRGDVAETVWTSDLSHEYVTINAEYRT